MEIGNRTKEGFTIVAVCGYCGKVHKYTNPKYYGWVYMDKYEGIKVNAWFCSEKCYLDNINNWVTSKKEFESWKVQRKR